MSADIQRKTGLFFGSFNPVHAGHLIIADYFVQYTDLDDTWFIVSPQNPFKVNESLLDERIRFDFVKSAIGGNSRFKVSDIEFDMDQPSYTYKTLKLLTAEYPGKSFVLIIGSDNLAEFDKWSNYEAILEMIDIYVYPRLGYDKSRFLDYPGVHLIDAPIIELSSSFIRKHIKEGKDPRYLLPGNVYKEIMEQGYYR